MILKGGTTSACAACKYQRRKCIPECLLAPYFPADQTKVFQNAHKLFGVSNIVKILKSLDPSQHAEAMCSIKYQANVRDRYPVYGCWGLIRQYYYQIQLLEEEFQAVLAQLEMYRQQHQHQQHQISPGSPNANDVPSQLQLGMAPPFNNANDNAVPLFNHHQVSLQQSYNSGNENIAGFISSPYEDSKDQNMGNNNSNNCLWIQQHPFLSTNNDNCSAMEIQSQQLLVPNSPQPLAHHDHVQQEIVQDDYNEIHPFFDTIDDRQSYIDSKEAYDTSSSEESLKDTTQSLQHLAVNELKSAAACFSLTSVN